MLYASNVSTITKWSQTNKNKKWLVFTYIKPYVQTKHKLIRKLSKQSKLFQQPLHIYSLSLVVLI